jgi:DNA mismatch repair ATPase MutS
MDELVNYVEKAISQYEQACNTEESLLQMIQDCDREISRLSSQASSSEEPSDQRQALEQMKAVAQQMQDYQRQLQQAQNQKTQSQRYLTVTRLELLNVIQTIEEKLPQIEQSIGIFEQASSNTFGVNASAQLPKLREMREEHQQNLNAAYNLVERIDAMLNGGGTSPKNSKTII